MILFSLILSLLMGTAVTAGASMAEPPLAPGSLSDIVLQNLNYISGKELSYTAEHSILGNNGGPYTYSLNISKTYYEQEISSSEPNMINNVIAVLRRN